MVKVLKKVCCVYDWYDEGLELEVLQHDVRDIVVHEQVHQLWQVLPVFYQQEEGHLCVDELTGNRVEVDLDGELLVSLPGGAHCLNSTEDTL